MIKKYELVKEKSKIMFGGYELYRIRALKDFGDVKKGDIGGYIGSEFNLSHEDNCWIYDDACVYQDARIYDNATVHHDAIICGEAEVYDKAKVNCKAKLYENSVACGNSYVSENAIIFGNAKIYGNAIIKENARIHGYAGISGYSIIRGEAEIGSNVEIKGDASIMADAHIESNDDYSIIYNFGPFMINTAITFFRCTDDIIKVVEGGDFIGTIDEFRNKVKEDYKNNKFAKEYLMIADLMEIKFYEPV